MRARGVVPVGVLALSGILVLAGCSPESGRAHPIDAAEALLAALADRDPQDACAMFADESGPIPDGERADCEAWLNRSFAQMTDSEADAIGDATVETVTLTQDPSRARVRSDDFETPGEALPTLELIKVEDRWYVTDMP
ncbi:hypothetical protein BJF80_00020 [Serinicoccus sp. CUA-874]|nr:hypothetical protein BJF80_00020 [Serinicoccus sp. CUA-874]OLT32407.1 hypothetical protein BJF82_15170 [Kytococcus sp. CUA-901]